jgi:hypothetical protein
LEVVEVEVHSTEDYTGPLRAVVEGEVAVDEQLQPPNTPSNPVEQAEAAEDLEATGVVGECNWAEEGMDFCSFSITTRSNVGKYIKSKEICERQNTPLAGCSADN